MQTLALLGIEEEIKKVVVAGDWHGNLLWMQRVLRAAAGDGHKVIVHVGDLAVLWPGASKFTTILKRLLEELDLLFIFADGNHDVHPALRALPLNADGFGVISDRLLYAPRGHRWSLSGQRFGALGGAYSVDRRSRVQGKSWWIGEEVTDRDVHRLGRERLDVLISHEVPMGIDVVSTIGGRLPEMIEREAEICRRLVRDAVRNTEPHLVFSGHWHQRRTGLMPGMATRVHVLDREFFSGNLVLLDLATLAVEDYKPV
ncbi:MAG TPA: metallophosphoesterase family protein [Arthrobacter sp.]